MRSSQLKIYATKSVVLRPGAYRTGGLSIVNLNTKVPVPIRAPCIDMAVRQ
jgi:hypothetical protein